MENKNARAKNTIPKTTLFVEKSNKFPAQIISQTITKAIRRLTSNPSQNPEKK